MKEPLVYIILPVYNGQNFLSQQLYTIIYQIYSNWHLVIINDGSNDKTMDIISDFISKYDIEDKVTIISQENLGQYASCGVGLEYVRKLLQGNYDNIYISYCDADDLRTKNKLRTQIEYMQTHPDCDLSYHDCWLIDDKNEIIGESAIMYFGSNFFSVNMKKFIDVGVGHTAISTELVFKAKFIEEILPVPSFMSQDWWVSICITAVNGKINKINKKLGYYRLHNFSSLNNKKDKIDFEKRQYDTFIFLKNIKSYGGQRNKIEDLDSIIEYRKMRLFFKNNKKKLLIKLVIMIFKFPKIMLLYLRNYLQLINYLLQLYRDGFKKRLKLHHRG